MTKLYTATDVEAAILTKGGSMDLPNNTITFSHCDLDGVGIGVLVKATIGSQSEVHYCGYDNVDERINKRLDEIERTHTNELPFILVADLGIKPETAERLNNYGGGKRWLDHHKTNIDIAAKYDWAAIDIEKCGTRLVFEKFDNMPFDYARFVFLVNQYDLWIHEDPQAKELNRLLYIVGIEKFEERFLINPNVEFNATESLLLELEDEAVEKYTRRVSRGLHTFETANDQRIGIGFAERFTSEVAHNLLEEKDLDAIALFDMNGKKISLRSKPHFDVGAIAKELGGGGHKNAAGVEYAYKDALRTFSSPHSIKSVSWNHDELIHSLFVRIKNAHEAIETKALEKLFEGVL